MSLSPILQAFFQRLPQPCLIVGREDVIFWLNDLATNLLAPLAPVTGESRLTELLPMAAALGEKLQAVRRHRQPWYSDWRQPTENLNLSHPFLENQPFYHRFCLLPLDYAGAPKEYIAVILEDVTEARLLLDRAELAEDALHNLSTETVADPAPALSRERLEGELRATLDEELASKEQALRQTLESELRPELEAEIRGALQDELEKEMGERLRAELEQERLALEAREKEIHEAARDELEDEVRTALQEAFDGKTDELRRTLEREIREQLEAEAAADSRQTPEDDPPGESPQEMESRLRREIQAQLENEMGEQLEGEIRSRLEAEIKDELLTELQQLAMPEGLAEEGETAPVAELPAVEHPVAEKEEEDAPLEAGATELSESFTPPPDSLPADVNPDPPVGHENDADSLKEKEKMETNQRGRVIVVTIGKKMAGEDAI